MEQTFKDFAAWAGGQSKAAEKIGMDKYRAHRVYHGRALTPEEATAIEVASDGVFNAVALIFGSSKQNNKNEHG